MNELNELVEISKQLRKRILPKVDSIQDGQIVDSREIGQFEFS